MYVICHETETQGLVPAYRVADGLFEVHMSRDEAVKALFDDCISDIVNGINLEAPEGSLARMRSIRASGNVSDMELFLDTFPEVNYWCDFILPLKDFEEATG